MYMNMEISEEFSASNDQIIVKGKRTKRMRPSSSASSSAAAAAADINSSPTTSSGISTTTTSTEQDEDLANCLILLARGCFGPKTERAESKFCSRRKFTEMATTTTTATSAAKVGMYVYECKTCSRTFPSFQALGGHRASHKRPKPAADFDQKKKSPPPPPPPYNQEKEEEKEVPPPSKPPQLLSHVEYKAKIHECSICRSEFASGQALGGHMRRHRSGPNSTAAAVSAAGRSDDDSSSHDHHHHRHVVVETKTRNVLALDLNLPAPAEDDRREVEFRAFSSKQQQRMVFSAAALVDCHY